MFAGICGKLELPLPTQSRHTSHWGRGPMEIGVYMLGTFQALAESSSNVLTRYISFTFHMGTSTFAFNVITNNVSFTFEM